VKALIGADKEVDFNWWSTSTLNEQLGSKRTVSARDRRRGWTWPVNCGAPGSLTVVVSWPAWKPLASMSRSTLRLHHQNRRVALEIFKSFTSTRIVPPRSPSIPPCTTRTHIVTIFRHLFSYDLSCDDRRSLRLPRSFGAFALAPH
jgi:hypothetical protein